MKKIYYYKTYKDDVVISNNQNYELPEDYKWIKTNKIYNFLSKIVYIIGKIFGNIYCRLFLKVTIENSDILRQYKDIGYFVYGNHTQEIGDVFIPAVVCKNERIFTIASPANLGIKIIGKLLPSLGILPTANNISQTRKLYKAVEQRIKEKHPVIIYPEAHVWPYYTKIRSFIDKSFKFQVDFDVPSFCMTTTYYKRKNKNKPGIKIYIDGPFTLDTNLTKKQNEEKLQKEIYECMVNRSKNSTYQYIEYKREKI